MSSTPEYCDYVAEQLSTTGRITRRPMFGEYTIYLDGVVIGLVCDNQFFAKITDAGLPALSAKGIEPSYGRPYPGARDYLIATWLDDAVLAEHIARVTATALSWQTPEISQTGCDQASG